MGHVRGICFHFYIMFALIETHSATVLACYMNLKEVWFDNGTTVETSMMMNEEEDFSHGSVPLNGN